MYIKGKFISGIENKEEIYEIRTAAGMITDAVSLDDSLAIHVIAYSVTEESLPMACARMIYDGEQYTIDNLNVKPSGKNQEYEDFVIKMLLYKAFEHKANEVNAIALLNDVVFYQNAGFKVISENVSENIAKLVIKQDEICRCCSK